MASAYASLVSLMNVLKQIQRPESLAHFNTNQIQSLFDKVVYFVDALESCSHKIGNDLVKKIVASASAAEHLVGSCLAGNGEETLSCPISLKDLDEVIQEMDYLIQEVDQTKAKTGEQDQLTSRGVVPIGSPTAPRVNAVEMVGVEEEMSRLMSLLTAHKSRREIIPVVGMGGLGKTTLATRVYNHQQIKCHFDVTAWVTVSQTYTTRSLFLHLLHDIGIHGTDQIKDENLGEKLHKGLYGRRYLIIIDDIWDVEAWYKLRTFFPEDYNRSRILLTTRLSDVAEIVGSCSPLELKLLNAGESWNLLSKRVFGEETCPAELKQIGEKIAFKCKGLPLAIVLIGGLLDASKRTKENWELVERNTSSMANLEKDEHCMKILSLSYQHLPMHLKPCFLYMATFPEDQLIRVSEVTKLWAADGFLKPVDGKTLSDVALECLTDLIKRSLIFVKKHKVRGAMKYITVHDLVRDLCIKEAQKEMFLYVHKHNGLSGFENTIDGHCRFVAQAKGLSYLENPRSYICSDTPHRMHLPKISMPSLLRVFSYPNSIDSVKYLMPFVSVRFLKLEIEAYTLSEFHSIALLSNLETLIACTEDDSDYPLPCEIWELRHMKHLIFSFMVSLHNPSTDVVLDNLETLMNVYIRSDEVLRRMPNVKKLKVVYARIEHENYVPLMMRHFDHCHKLETLKFLQIQCLGLGNSTFPSNLKKLTLAHTQIRWESMTIIGSLENLEYLALLADAFSGEEWQTTEGEFQSLTCLSIKESNLMKWTVEDCSHFPSLEHLIIHNMTKLEEIPQSFAEIMPLASIKVVDCLISTVISAKLILDERQAMGNSDLIVEATLPESDKVKLEAELDGLSNDNFLLQAQSGNSTSVHKPLLEVCLVGLQSSGKSSLSNFLNTWEYSEDTVPTIGFHMRRLKFGSATISIWDLGGQPRFRSLWERYCRPVSAIIYVVDAADHDNISISRSELHDLVSKQSLKGIPLLVLGNKIDKPWSLSKEALADQMNLSAITDRELCCYMISLKNSTNVDPVLDWLIKHIKKTQV